MKRFMQFLLEEPMETQHYDKSLTKELLQGTDVLSRESEKIHNIDGYDIFHLKGNNYNGSTLLFCPENDTDTKHGVVELGAYSKEDNSYQIKDSFSAVPKMNLYGKLFDTMVGEKGHSLVSDDLLTPSSAKRWVDHIKEGKYKYTAISPYEKDIPLHAGNIDEVLPKIYGKNTNMANFNFKVSPKEKS